MPLQNKWSNYKVGDFLHLVEDYGDQLYEIIEMGGKDSTFHLKARCFFGDDYGREITIYKLNKEDE